MQIYIPRWEICLPSVAKPALKEKSCGRGVTSNLSNGDREPCNSVPVRQGQGQIGNIAVEVKRDPEYGPAVARCTPMGKGAFRQAS